MPKGGSVRVPWRPRAGCGDNAKGKIPSNTGATEAWQRARRKFHGWHPSEAVGVALASAAGRKTRRSRTVK
ncbi:hypothetical protein DDE82_002127 [Stemphylium lycopersici]|nr:hypothetical protein TW65_04688 [Stemphylium lycopersici]RAR08837.1 hypothetical protein DDE82_002127 [Stemphylium lycopersici]